jgi:hypothetical protein
MNDAGRAPLRPIRGRDSCIHVLSCLDCGIDCCENCIMICGACEEFFCEMCLDSGLCGLCEEEHDFDNLVDDDDFDDEDCE